MHCFSFLSDVNPRAPKRPTRGAPKRPRVRTSDHRTCGQKPVTIQALESCTRFLILLVPDEFIDNQIDNVAIAKNCQKGPRAARDPSHPWSGALQFCVNVLKHLLGVVQPRLDTYHLISLWSEDPKGWTESAEVEGAQQCKNLAVLKEILSALRRQTVDSRLLTMKWTYCWFCGEEWKWISKSTAIVWHAPKPCKSI